VVSEFTDFDDLVGALLSSCHIPLYCGWPARHYRGRWRVDGGWTQLTPTPPGLGGGGGAAAVRVSAFPLLEAWGQSVAGDGAETGNYFAQQASFWDGWGEWDERGGLIAPDGAGGEPQVEYTAGLHIHYRTKPHRSGVSAYMPVCHTRMASNGNRCTGVLD